MSQIRVFVIDDSVVFRKILMEAINDIPGVRTVGVAANGKEALQAIPLVKPDLITLDLNMPVMDGLETLKGLRHVYPQFQVIMVSAYTIEGAQETLKALEAGALDFITKPDTGNSSLNSTHLRDQLAALIGTYVNSEINPHSRAVPAPPPAQHHIDAIAGRSERSVCSTKPEIVAVGISTGGPIALSALLSSLPQHFPLPIVIVQHMPRLFTKTLAESLQRKSRIKVIEACDAQPIEPSTAYIAPGGCQMKVSRDAGPKTVIRITDDSPENHCKPSADYLFRSIAQVYGSKAIGVIMTGMGSDGVLGLRLMKRQGAFIIAQDRLSCTVWGMPRMALEAGVVDTVQSLDAIGTTLVECAEVR